MHCPKCGQQQITDQTRFCSRCGFLLTGVAQVVENEGIVPMPAQARLASGSPRRRGVMQGTFIFLLSFLIVPLVAIICMALTIGPEPVAITAILLTVGGLLRIAYALMFESGVSGGNTLEQNVMPLRRTCSLERRKPPSCRRLSRSPLQLMPRRAPAAGVRPTNWKRPAASPTARPNCSTRTPINSR